MKVINLDINGLKLIEPDVFSDDRGVFFESYNQEKFHQIGIDDNFVQDNQSLSNKNVLRGLHFQTGVHAQAKLVRVIKGGVIDVAVDLRNDSPTFGQHYSVELNDKNNFMLYIPIGFAHGFVALMDQTVFAYKCSSLYNKSSESGIIWSDKQLNINWGDVNPLISNKDAILPTFDINKYYF